MDGEVLQMSVQPKTMDTNWDYEFSGPLKGLINPAIQRPLRSAAVNGSPGAADGGRGIGDGRIRRPTFGPTRDGQSHVTPEENIRDMDDNDDDAGGSYNEFLSPLTTESKKIVKASDFHQDKANDDDDDDGDGDDDGDENDEDDDEEEEGDDEDEVEATSIPNEIGENSACESNTSSLSSSSDLDNSDASSHASDENVCEQDEQFRGESMGYDTDQAHVSQVVGLGDEDDEGDRVGNDRTDDDSLSPAPSAVCSPEEAPQSSSYTNPSRPHQPQSKQDPTAALQTFFQNMLSFCSAIIVHYPAQAFLQLFNLVTTTIRQSPLCSSLAQHAESLNRQLDKMSTWSRAVWQWLVDVNDVLTALIATLLTTIRKLLATITNFLILIASLIFQVWKFSLIEAVEESSVTICYLVFYFMPNLCSLLMRHVNFPHWTPHIMTWLGVFSLCHQVKSGPLHQDDGSIFRLSGTLTSTTDNGTPPSSPVWGTDKQGPETRPRDERACRTILRILRCVLPVFFLADGFSSEFGTIMGVSGASRLTTAFMMSLVRKNLVSSPVGWVSWAIQVLVATYYLNWTFVDCVVLVVGLSSIRLIRYLDGQHVRSKRRTGKND